jgi:hypothetical protein
VKRLLLAAWVAVVLPGQAAPSMAEAFEAAWQRSSVSAEASGQQRRAEAERTAAGALWAAPPALTVDQVQNRQGLPGSNTATRETELGVAVPLWLPGQRTAREAEAESALAEVAARSKALRLQLVISIDHRRRADLVAARAVAHRGQARTGRQQARADAFGKALGGAAGQLGGRRRDILQSSAIDPLHG